MKRGDLVPAALPGDLGKPRPALIIQANQFHDSATITLLPLTSTVIDAPWFRLTVTPSVENGLRRPSQIMVDKTTTLRRNRIGPPFGRLDDETMAAVTRALALYLGFA